MGTRFKVDGVEIELNKELHLRAHGSSERKAEECLPEFLREGNTHDLLKKGQRNYHMVGDIPLKEVGVGEEVLASVRITKAIHCLYEGDIWTKGSYRIVNINSRGKRTVSFDSSGGTY